MARRARLVGFNHVAIEVGSLEEALEFYGRIFEVELRGSRITDDAQTLSDGDFGNHTAPEGGHRWL